MTKSYIPVVLNLIQDLSQITEVPDQSLRGPARDDTIHTTQNKVK